MRPQPDRRVVLWFTAQPATSLYTSAVTEAEILHGLLLLPAGRRRDAFEAAAEAMFKEDFSGRILAFDSDAARAYARITVLRHRAGRPISQFDAQIAAIAQTVGATIATRNVKDYAGCGVKLVDPWNA